MYNHNKAQQSKNRVHIAWDILYMYVSSASSFHITKIDFFFSESLRVQRNLKYVSYLIQHRKMYFVLYSIAVKP